MVNVTEALHPFGPLALDLTIHLIAKNSGKGQQAFIRFSSSSFQYSNIRTKHLTQPTPVYKTISSLKEKH
jgi:hypothetical protein